MITPGLSCIGNYKKFPIDDLSEESSVGYEALVFTYGYNVNIYRDVFDVSEKASSRDIEDSCQYLLDNLKFVRDVINDTPKYNNDDFKKKVAILLGMTPSQLIGGIHPRNYVDIKIDAVKCAYQILANTQLRLEYDGYLRDLGQQRKDLGDKDEKLAKQIFSSSWDQNSEKCTIPSHLYYRPLDQPSIQTDPSFASYSIETDTFELFFEHVEKQNCTFMKGMESHFITPIKNTNSVTNCTANISYDTEDAFDPFDTDSELTSGHFQPSTWTGKTEEQCPSMSCKHLAPSTRYFDNHELKKDETSEIKESDEEKSTSTEPMAVSVSSVLVCPLPVRENNENELTLGTDINKSSDLRTGYDDISESSSVSSNAQSRKASAFKDLYTSLCKFNSKKRFNGSGQINLDQRELNEIPMSYTHIRNNPETILDAERGTVHSVNATGEMPSDYGTGDSMQKEESNDCEKSSNGICERASYHEPNRDGFSDCSSVASKYNSELVNQAKGTGCILIPEEYDNIALRDHEHEEGKKNNCFLSKKTKDPGDTKARPMIETENRDKESLDAAVQSYKSDNSSIQSNFSELSGASNESPKILDQKPNETKQKKCDNDTYFGKHPLWHCLEACVDEVAGTCNDTACVLEHVGIKKNTDTQKLTG